MKRKVLSMVMTLTLLVLTIGAAKPASAKTSTGAWNTARYGDVQDIDPKLKAMDDDIEAQAKLDEQIKKSASEISKDEATAGTETSEGSTASPIGTQMVFPADNAAGGYAYLKYFTLRSIGQKCEVWVANNLAYPAGDSRPAPVITDDEISKVVDAFDNNIYQKDTEFFGTPDSHTGEKATLPDMVGLPQDYYKPIDGTERVIILVDNVRDENYYNPTYPFYVAGFYWGTIERYTDRNIITLDTNKWESRLEDTYLPTVAHEFQHLIHADNDSGEETWINEGMSDFAEYLCGYGQPWGHINYFLDHPENSLVSWDEYYNYPTGPETLADYGQAYLLQLYLDDHFGRDFIQALAKNKDHGIQSVNEVLEQFNTGIDFNELFRRFTVALSVDSKNPGNGIYNFDSIDVKVDYAGAVQYNKPGVPAWGADYIKLETKDIKTKDIKNIKFDGIDFLPIPWQLADDPAGSGSKVLWGNQGDELSNQIILPVDLTGKTSATLKFDTLYDIEEQWDFGIVQVSTDNGKTWNSLSNGDTRSDVVDEGYPAIKANVPGFTGIQDTWKTEEFNLSPYAGSKILISFRYMTDWGSNGNGALETSGWYIKNIAIPEVGYTNTCTSMDGFESIQKVLGTYVDYMVTFVNEKYTNKGTDPQHYQVKTIDPLNITQEDAKEIQKFLSSGNNYMIVWYAAPAGVKTPVDYNYQIITKNKFNKVKK